MNIMLCNTTDVPTIVEVLLCSYKQNYTHMWIDSGKRYMAAKFNEEVIATEMSFPNSQFYLIYIGDSPVGVLKLNLSKSLGKYKDSEAIELERIYLTDEATGQGIGSKVVDFAIHIANTHDKTILWLRAMERSKALSFYLRKGFQIMSYQDLNSPEIKEEYKRMAIMNLLL